MSAPQDVDPEMWERANLWAIAKLQDAGHTNGDNPDAQTAQAALITAALAVPTLIDTDDDGTTTA